VAAALQSAWPEPRKKLAKRGSRLDPCKEAIDHWLRAEQGRWRHFRGGLDELAV
jgi:hypothetical protein